MNLYYEMTTVYGVELTEEEAEKVRNLAKESGCDLDEAAADLIDYGFIDPWSGAREPWIANEGNNNYYSVYDD